MRSRHRRPIATKPKAAAGTALGLVLVVAGLYIAGLGVGSDTAQAGERGGNTGRARTVTLVTGDRVTVSTEPAGGPTIQPGVGRRDVQFVSSRVQEHLHVIPIDALPLLNSGRLDARLFDVTELLARGFGDDRRADLPLIVSYASATDQRASTSDGATVVRRLPSVTATAVRADKGRMKEFWDGTTTGNAAKSARGLRAGIAKVWLDGLLKPTLDQSVPQIGAPAAWQAGYTGAGVTVAVLDTGIDATHPDLSGRVVAAADFTEDADGLDRVGHGTHVASTIAGSGAASSGRYRGVAPDTRLLDGKVCTADGCYESAVVAGMEWAVVEQHAKVVNLSLGGRDTTDEDPTEAAVRRLTEQYGALFVVAAGNTGADETVSSPASADAALAIGAVSKSDELAPFSSRGPRTGDAVIKPDLTAPGVDITAARSSQGAEGEAGQQYVTMSGTSMATPHVTGSAAILAQQHPDWSPARLKAALMASAQPRSGVDVFAQGAGRVDVAHAVTQPVTTDPASVSLGRQLWPHDDDGPTVHTLTYLNSAATGLTLRLAIETAGPDGKPAPEGMFRLSADEVSVPAGGQAQVTLTSNTRAGNADGHFGGYVTATATGVVARTAIAVDREPESYDVTFAHLDRSGAPAGQFRTILTNLDTAEVLWLPPRLDGNVTVRLRKGRYLLSSAIPTQLADGRSETSMLVQPVLDPATDRQVNLDARLAKPVNARPERAAASASASVMLDQQIGDMRFIDLLWGSDFRGMYTAQIGPGQPATGFTSSVAADFAEPGPAGDFADTPYVYHLAWYQRGTMPTGFSRTVADRDLAKVVAQHATAGPDSFSVKSASPSLADGSAGGGISYGIAFKGPFALTEYYTSAPDLRWSDSFIEVAGQQFDETLSLSAGPRELVAAQTYRETWNQPVFSPSLAAPPDRKWYVSRTGDKIFVLLPLFDDSEGHRGFASLLDERYTLYRDGVQVGEVVNPSGEPGWEFTVPAQRSTYRLEIETRRTPGMPLSSHVTTAWTFQSEHTSGQEPVRVPLSAVRFAPALDSSQAAPASRPFELPVSVERQPGSAAATTVQLAVDVSYDDGQNWEPVRLTPCATGWTGHLTHPGRTGYVSLRSRALDTTGNTVEQTVIHAYNIR